MLTNRTKAAISLALSSLVWCSGCGAGGGDRVPVAGVVTLDGKPMPGIQVTLDRPELSANENKAYFGVTDASGRYTLRAAGEKKDGIPPAEYRVSLSTVAADPASPAPPPKQTTIFFPEAPPPPPERVPPAYLGGKLKFTVPAGGTDKADFALTSK